jgi:hypothetical protein
MPLPQLRGAAAADPVGALENVNRYAGIAKGLGTTKARKAGTDDGHRFSFFHAGNVNILVKGAITIVLPSFPLIFAASVLS